MKKFINPLKPHIVELTSGKFVVRRWSFGWKYYDNQKVKKDDYWWNGYQSTSAQYYELDTFEEAKLLLELTGLRKQIKSRRAVKVWQ